MTLRALKLDQNMPERVAAQLRREGFDAMTVREQDMAGAPDPDVFAICQAEDRILMTFDLDFADIRAYPPATSCGTVVLRPSSQDARSVSELVADLVPRLKSADPRGELWVVEEGRVRVRAGD